MTDNVVYIINHHQYYSDRREVNRIERRPEHYPTRDLAIHALADMSSGELYRRESRYAEAELIAELVFGDIRVHDNGFNPHAEKIAAEAAREALLQTKLDEATERYMEQRWAERMAPKPRVIKPTTGFLLHSRLHGTQEFTREGNFVFLNGQQLCMRGYMTGPTLTIGKSETLEQVARQWWREYLRIERQHG